MKTRRFVAGMVALFVMFVATSATTYGQDDEPDLEVKDSDILFSSGSYAIINSYIFVHANVRNIENCYIALGENDDEVGYDHDFEQLDYIKVKVRVRSPNNGNIFKPIAFQARIGNAVSSVAETYSTEWEEWELKGLTVPPSSNDRLNIVRVNGTEDFDLEIDRIKIYYDYDFLKGVWNKEIDREGEDYDAGGNTVDWIYPSNVQVKFYDGDPSSGGKQISGTKIVGNVQKTVETGSVKILTENGKASTHVTWQAKPLGWHKIYVDITPDPREEITDNNKAYRWIEVVTLISSLWKTGLLP